MSRSQTNATGQTSPKRLSVRLECQAPQAASAWPSRDGVAVYHSAQIVRHNERVLDADEVPLRANAFGPSLIRLSRVTSGDSSRPRPRRKAKTQGMPTLLKKPAVRMLMTELL